MERFSLDLVSDPTAVSNSDRGSVYNNILTFTVVDDPHRNSSSEMHLFQIVHRAVSRQKYCQRLKGCGKLSFNTEVL